MKNPARHARARDAPESHFPTTMSHIDFKGAYTALVTPMRQGRVDYAGLERLVEAQVAAGIDGLVAVGTTGESPTLNHAEHMEVVAAVVRMAAGRVPVLAGTGSNSTDEAVELTRQSDRCGADGMLVVAPYYNKPSQAGLVRHFSAVAAATGKPIMLYSIPGRCGIEIAVDTVARLAAQFPHVCSLKEAGGSCDKVSRLRQVLDARFALMCGDDSLTVPFMALGARGVVSVASNILPAELVQLTRLMLANDFAAARALHDRLYPIFTTLFCEPNPVPAKTLMARMGLIASPEVRLPLCEMDPANAALLLKAAAQSGIAVP